MANRQRDLAAKGHNPDLVTPAHAVTPDEAVEILRDRDPFLPDGRRDSEVIHRDCVACGTGTTDTHGDHALDSCICPGMSPADMAYGEHLDECPLGEKSSPGPIHDVRMVDPRLYTGSYHFSSDDNSFPPTEVAVSGPITIVLLVLEQTANAVMEELHESHPSPSDEASK